MEYKYLITKYVRCINNQTFVNEFKKRFCFSDFDIDPTEDQIVKIFLKEPPQCTFYIIQLISKRIMKEGENLMLITELKKDDVYFEDMLYPELLDYRLADSMSTVSGILSFNIMMKEYFYFRQNNKNCNTYVGKIFKEIISYDQLAINHYGKSYIKNAIAEINSAKDSYSFSVYKRFKRKIDDTISVNIDLVKKIIGFISILSTYDNINNNNNPISYIFFDDISFYHRKMFKKYLDNLYP
ncbi:4L [Yaba monkey tumor virus]|uniref:4L n=1 Tax=Yaba monkey tumor virus (strain VR587) TaxID=928314 RepID=Q6TV03_YMTV5|nr:putative alpha aminitin-sensitive protein [Yaba monkey tumor virus]AAR07366.1 4L [Yaba monkey tumor virus]